MQIKTDTLAQLLHEVEHLNRNQAAEDQTLEAQVRTILATVQTEGDNALKRYAEDFDQVTLDQLRIPTSKVKQALDELDPDLRAALEQAKTNIQSFHLQQKQTGFTDEPRPGVTRGQLVRPLETVGVYVPGGTASYPSSVLMNVLPAKIAGVKKIIMVTPPHPAGVAPVILAAADLAGVDELYQVGGAQAIAALTYGTESIPKVDKIVGPGNAYVAKAKQLVYGQVAIDMIAGPSEIGIIADQEANPDFIAADLLSQAEHDSQARAILVTPSRSLAEKVAAAVEQQLDSLPRVAIARKAWQEQGQIFVVANLSEAFELMNCIAPEHLELQLVAARSYLNQVEHAGSIFIGAFTSEPIGDYLAGTNHVLPTSGTARFSSGLGVHDFIKYSQFVEYSQAALVEDAAFITTLARVEGLEGHARAIEIRMKKGV